MKKYHKEYKLEKVYHSDGKEEKSIQYEGDFYLLPLNEGEKKKLFLRCLVTNSLAFLLLILSGLLNNAGSRNLFISLPYAFLFLPSVYSIMANFSMLKIEAKMERVTYDKSIGRMYRSYIGIIVITICICVADILFFVANKQIIEQARESAFLCMIFLLFVVGCIQSKYLQNVKKKVTICKCKNEVQTDK